MTRNDEACRAGRLARLAGDEANPGSCPVGKLGAAYMHGYTVGGQACRT